MNTKLDWFHDTLKDLDSTQQIIYGTAVNQGWGIGRAVFHLTHEYSCALPKHHYDQNYELARLKSALDVLDNNLKTGCQNLISRASEGEHVRLLEAYQMLAKDKTWRAYIKQELIINGISAEQAVMKVRSMLRTRLSQLFDNSVAGYFHDMEDLSNALLQTLASQSEIRTSFKNTGTSLLHSPNNDNKLFELNSVGSNCPPTSTEGIRQIILVAHNLGTSDLLDYISCDLAGIILEERFPPAHLIIIAKALNIPVIIGVPDVFVQLTNNQVTIVSGDWGEIFVKPNQRTLSYYYEHVEKVRKGTADSRVYSMPSPIMTKDRQLIELETNANLLSDVAAGQQVGASGVGLYRTEIAFMLQNQLPTFEQQLKLYQQVLGHAAGKPVTFRTLDIGGDKPIGTYAEYKGHNPAMGWRAARISLDNPRLLKQQVRAILTAARSMDLATPPLVRIMFPLVTMVEEFKILLNIVKDELLQLPYPHFQVGVMMEVPSLAWQLDTLLPLVDFMAVGTNDLHQFFFAADRSDQDIAARYNCLLIPFWLLLRQIHQQCVNHNVPVHVCGEMSSSPLNALVLMGLGFRRLSMIPSAMMAVKQMIVEVNLQDFTDFINYLISEGDNEKLRYRLEQYCHDHNIL